MTRPIPQPEAGAIRVIHEDHDFLVIDKPAELTVHPTAKRATGTLANLLVARFPELAGVGEAHRPGIVHRLDRDVSGVMVVARTQRAYEYLKNLFAEHTVKKEYAAVVQGVVHHENGKIDVPLGRTKKGAMAVVAVGAPAITHFEVLRRGVRATLLKITTETGRMHQIRVHLRHIGHPIVGDALYGKCNAPVKSDRLLLHATRIGFAGLDGKELSFKSALPEEFTAVP
jgi:23S rRNA pseudouridine1911/1915/1917 synthase